MLTCAERRRNATSPVFDGPGTSGGSSTAASAGGSSPQRQSSVAGCSRSGSFLFPLNLASRRFGVVGDAACRLADEGTHGEARRGDGRASTLPRWLPTTAGRPLIHLIYAHFVSGSTRRPAGHVHCCLR